MRGVHGRSPLVGRTAELAHLESRLASAQRGEGRVTLLAGPAGVGKTRLARELAAIGREQGVELAYARCFDTDTSIAYAPLLDLIQSDPLRAPARDLLGHALLAHLRDSYAPATAALRAPDERELERRQFHKAVLLSLRESAAIQPLLLILDDVHWCDEPTLDLLLFVIRHWPPDIRAIMLLTYRREDTGSALRSFLGAVSREPVVEELRIAPLAPPDAEALVRALLPDNRREDRGEVARLARLTDGIPHFIEETARELRRWPSEPDAATGSAAAPMPIPHVVLASVRARLQNLSSPSREILLVAAVAGQRFDFSLLAEVTGREESDIAAAMKELLAAGLVVKETPDGLAFRHALTRVAIQSELLARERRALHARIAEAIEMGDQAATDHARAELAAHWFEAGVWEKALTYARGAGERELANHAPHAAAQHFGLAVAAARALGRAPEAALLSARGRAFETIGEFEPARADYEAALATARMQEDQRAISQTLLDLGFLWSARNYERSGEYLQEALRSAREVRDPRLLAANLNRVGNWHKNLFQLDRARAYHEEALRLYEQLDDRAGLAETADLLGLATANAGFLEEGLAHIRRAATLYEEVGNLRGLVSTLSMLAQFAVELPPSLASMTPDIERAVEGARRAVATAREIAWRAGESFALMSLVRCLAGAGEYHEAFATGRQALVSTEEIDHREWMAASHGVLASIYWNFLAFPTALAHLERGLAVAAEAHSSTFLRSSRSPWPARGLRPASSIARARPLGSCLKLSLRRIWRSFFTSCCARNLSSHRVTQTSRSCASSSWSAAGCPRRHSSSARTGELMLARCPRSDAGTTLRGSCCGRSATQPMHAPRTCDGRLRWSSADSIGHSGAASTPIDALRPPTL